MARSTIGTRLPRDWDGFPIQVAAPDPDTIVNDDIDGASDVLALPTDAEIVELSVSTDCWITFGTAGTTVTNSTGHFMPKGAVVYKVPEGATHIVYLQASEAGRISVVKLV